MQYAKNVVNNVKHHLQDVFRKHVYKVCYVNVNENFVTSYFKDTIIWISTKAETKAKVINTVRAK